MVIINIGYINNEEKITDHINNIACFTKAEDGYDLWLRYKKISNNSLLDQYKKQITSPVVLGSSQTIAIIKTELTQAFSGLTGTYL